jgi:mannosyl-3-phosphoglycerate phosphatase
MKVIFTDLDGTLLDHTTYSWDAARPALDCLDRNKVPLIIVTSKTRVEVEFLRAQLPNHDPFVVENGGAAYVPTDYFPFSPPGAVHNYHYDVLEWGTKYAELVTDLSEVSRQSQCRVHAFHDMTTAEIASACDLPLEQAEMARMREYDEPFHVLDQEHLGQLLAGIEAKGLRWTKGGRFWHITGANDKAVAVSKLIELYTKAFGKVETIGLGDAENDAPFLNIVDFPVLVRGPAPEKLQAAVPRGVLTDQKGPAGWNEAVLSLISSSASNHK